MTTATHKEELTIWVQRDPLAKAWANPNRAHVTLMRRHHALFENLPGALASVADGRPHSAKLNRPHQGPTTADQDKPGKGRPR